MFILMAALMVGVPLTAQPPAEKQDSDKKIQKDYSNSPVVTRMMAFNKKKDGNLTKEEVTDPRLLRLFDRADANKDGVVTKEELMALAAQIDAEYGQGGQGPGGFGDKGPKGPKGKGPGGPGGFGGPPQPGQILPQFMQQQLQLTADQKKDLSDLQKQVDDKLGKILTDQQKQQLRDMSQKGPGGFGPPPGFGGPFGGGPPKGKDD